MSDNQDQAIEHRLRTWMGPTQEVAAHYDDEEKLLWVDANDELDVVYKKFEAKVMETLKEKRERSESWL